MTLSKTYCKYYYNFLHLTVNPPSKEDIQVFYFLESKTVSTMVAFLYILADRVLDSILHRKCLRLQHLIDWGKTPGFVDFCCYGNLVISNQVFL